MREKLKGWPALAAVRRMGNAEVQNNIRDKFILWGVNAAGGSLWRAFW
jgi:hypothetical protein